MIRHMWHVRALAIGTDVAVVLYSTIDIDPEEEPKIGHDISVIFFLLFIFGGARVRVLTSECR